MNLFFNYKNNNLGEEGYAFTGIFNVHVDKIKSALSNIKNNNEKDLLSIVELIHKKDKMDFHKVTEGQLATVLMARKYIDEEAIFILSSDTYTKSNIAKHIENKPDDCKGIISVINIPGDQWSFAKIDKMGNVTEVTEKSVYQTMRAPDYTTLVMAKNL